MHADEIAQGRLPRTPTNAKRFRICWTSGSSRCKKATRGSPCWKSERGFWVQCSTTRWASCIR